MVLHKFSTTDKIKINMGFVRFLVVAFLLIGSFRCPMFGQAALEHLQGTDTGSNELACARIVDYFSRTINVTDNGQTYFSLGIRFDRATTLAAGNQWVLERQARAGLPLVAGCRLGRFVVEAGGFLGVDMSRPQAAYLSVAPVEGAREFSRSTGLMMGMGMQVFEAGRLNLQYMHLDDLPEHTALGRLNLGWQWTW
jgi:hypothetical protein